jgi:uncharacterized Zn-finger protein
MERIKQMDNEERSRGKRVEQPAESLNQEQENSFRNVRTTASNEWRCEWQDCIKVCKSKGGLSIHIKRMHASNGASFNCNKCGKTLSQEANLRNHEKICSGVRATSTGKSGRSYCNKEFSKANIARHRRMCQQRNAQNNSNENVNVAAESNSNFNQSNEGMYRGRLGSTEERGKNVLYVKVFLQPLTWQDTRESAQRDGKWVANLKSRVIARSGQVR